MEIAQYIHILLDTVHLADSAPFPDESKKLMLKTALTTVSKTEKQSDSRNSPK